MIVLDTETTGLSWHHNKITHIGIYGEDGYFEINPVTERGYSINRFNEVAVMHNGRFDTLMMSGTMKIWKPWRYDTMLLSQLYDSRVRHNLDNLGNLYLGEGKFGDKKVLQAIKKGEFWMLPQDIQRSYLERDCTLTYRLFEFFKDKLDGKLWNLYESFDQPVSVALAEIERHGFTINEGLLQTYKKELSERIEDKKAELKEELGDINFNSPKQLLPALLNASSVTLSNTDESTLKKIAKYVPVAGKILEYRELNKYLSTYVEGIEKHLWQGKVYPQFHLAGDTHRGGTQTGRTSSSHPNLQNQPRNSSGPVRIRELFQASSGSCLLAADYSQLELKVAAYLAEDDSLLQGDIHQQAADILKSNRQIGKTCNFAMLYGAGFKKLFATTGGSKHVEKYQEWFKESFPKTVAWVEAQRERIEQDGRIQTYLGRVRFMDQANAGANTCIQGTAGDIGKEALLKVHQAGYKVLGLIHDEVLIEVPRGDLQGAVADIPRLMTTGLTANKDIVDKTNMSVTVKVGENWGAMKEYERQTTVQR